MNIKDVKNNLNRNVIYKGAKGVYKFTGCTLRKGEKGFYYQAELLDIKSGNSVLICELSNIEAEDKK